MRHRTNRYFLMLVGMLSLLLGSCGEDMFEPPDLSAYPTTIWPLSPDSLRILKLEYAAFNPKICSSLDAFGLTRDRLCRGSQGLSYEDADVDQLVGLAKQTLFENKQFTRVTSVDDLVVNHTGGGTDRLRITFEQQVYEDLEVLFSGIIVDMDSIGAFNIYGNWYQDIFLPPIDLLTARKAQESILGLEIPWYGIGGQRQVYVVTEESFLRPPSKVIFPLRSEESIEVRVAWEIPAGLWKVYVDTKEGDVLFVRQLFIT